MQFRVPPDGDASESPNIRTCTTFQSRAGGFTEPIFCSESRDDDDDDGMGRELRTRRHDGATPRNTG